MNGENGRSDLQNSKQQCEFMVGTHLLAPPLWHPSPSHSALLPPAAQPEGGQESFLDDSENVILLSHEKSPRLLPPPTTLIRFHPQRGRNESVTATMTPRGPRGRLAALRVLEY